MEWQNKTSPVLHGVVRKEQLGGTMRIYIWSGGEEENEREIL